MADIHKAGLLAIRDGRLLLCRKKKPPQNLILPGGKLEPGETSLECLHREIREELGEDCRARRLQHIGVYVHRAAGNADKTVRIELFRGDLSGRPIASAEIRELVWFGEHDDRAELAPSLSERIIPDLIARRFLAWRK